MSGVAQHGDYSGRYEFRHPGPVRRAQVQTVAREEGYDPKAVGRLVGKDPTAVVPARALAKKLRAARMVGLIRKAKP